MTGIVLSGGENSRMGTDKAFLKIAGTTMIERVLRPMRSVFQHIIIVTNAPHLYAGCGATVVTDVFAKRGPLNGIYTGLLRSTDEYNFVVACDMPFLNPSLMAYMTGLAEGFDVVVPSINGLLEPLHAVYRKGLVTIIEQQIRQEKQQIRELYRMLRVRHVTAQEVDRFDPERKSFKNLNTQSDYEEAACADSVHERL